MNEPLPDPAALLTRIRGSLPAMIGDIAALISAESPSSDLSAIAASAAVVAQVGRSHLNAEPERIVIDGCTHLRWRLGNDGSPRVLLVGHHDTVWPIGSLARRPFAVDGDVLRGPGCLDMKTGLVMAFHAVAAIQREANITILVTGDEETGSQTSRDLIESEARASSAALVLEAAADSGAVKVARKGATTYRVAIAGRASHAGLAPDQGISATLELAHQIPVIHALSDPEQGTTVTPTRASAGTTTNTIAAQAECFVDVRAWTLSEQQRIDHAMKSLRPHLDGASLDVTRRTPRPPMTTGASRSLFARAQRAASRLGLEPLTAESVGGASDANLTAAAGTPTLDGLGAVGSGAHAADEHVLVHHVPERTALLALSIAGVLFDTEEFRSAAGTPEIAAGPG